MHEHARWSPMEGPRKGPFIIEPEDYPYGVFVSRADRADVVNDVGDKIMTQGYVHHRVHLGENLVVRDDPDPDGEHLGPNGGYTSPIVRVIRQDGSKNVYVHTKNNSVYQVSPRHERDGNRVRITPFEKTMRTCRTACLALLGTAAAVGGVAFVTAQLRHAVSQVMEIEAITDERNKNIDAYEAAVARYGYSGPEHERAYAEFTRKIEELNRRKQDLQRGVQYPQGVLPAANRGK